MCDINLNSSSRKKIGYKVLAVKDGKFYSTFTGQEMKIGKVELAPVMCQRLSGYWRSSMDTRKLYHQVFYNQQYDGFSAAFINSKHAKELFLKMSREFVAPGFTLCVVKIQFAGTIHDGNYGWQIIAGNEIKSITRLKYKEYKHPC